MLSTLALSSGRCVARTPIIYGPSRLACRATSSQLVAARHLSAGSLPKNEPILEYTGASFVNSKHRKELEECLGRLTDTHDIPIVIDGKEYRTELVQRQRVPFDHRRRLAQFYHATPELIHKAIKVCQEKRRDWAAVPIENKARLLERAANLVSGKYRQRLNAATILGQAKTIKQAEIDSACELADFLRFNAYYMRRLSEFSQPESPRRDVEENRTRLMPLGGFVAAISPFNFTAIGGNLATAPALMGNCVIWKPSDQAMLSNYVIFQLLHEAGLPEGVINFVPSEGLDFGRAITGDADLAGINFTGSLQTFQWLFSETALNVRHYRTFPRLVGECGGKNFHLVHESANIDVAVAQTVKSAFEYSGQKCSACSRLYVPKSLWNSTMRDRLVSIVRDELKIEAATQLDSAFTSAVIDKRAHTKCSNYMMFARSEPLETSILCGGNASDEVGYFVEPTVMETKNAENRIMLDEIFGPILCVYPYEPSEVDQILELIDGSQFALTGAVFARDEAFIEKALGRLEVGNFYVNDKSTGAVVGQQPFGGWRHSGTNDKAGGPHYLMRWCNQQTIKRAKKELVAYK